MSSEPETVESIRESVAPHASPLRRAIAGNVLSLGIVSFLTDVSSEMIYPLLPAFFAGMLSATSAAAWVGIMDGVAESVSAILKMYSGRVSDLSKKRKPLAVLGYGISTLSRPIVALATMPWHVVGLRFTDRIGKGLRTSPRDALIGDSVDSDVRGVAFSFHRAMDHAGAVLGPALAGVVLFLMLGSAELWQVGTVDVGRDEVAALRIVFGLALIPGLISLVVLWFGVREPKAQPTVGPTATTADTSSDNPLPRYFKVFLAAVALFSLGNSTDLFIVFYLQTAFRLGLGHVIGLWIALHIAKVTFSLPGGHLSDRAGRLPAILAGWTVYFAVYAALPFATSLVIAWGLIILYGMYYGMTEGAERALIADLVGSSHRGRAFGLYHGTLGLTVLPANLLFGFLWARFGPQTAFFFGAGLAAAAMLVLVWTALAARRATATP